LRGRTGEVSVLADLVAAVRARQSRVLVVRGEPGAGKTALLDYLAGQARGCRVVRAAGTQSEMELAFAGLHRLLAPILDRLEQLPVPQRDALRTAFGLPGALPGARSLTGRIEDSFLPAASGRPADPDQAAAVAGGGRPVGRPVG
jgi:AAA ATPase domain